jgi:hypothetical protein
MKNLFFTLFALGTVSAIAQPKGKESHMAPIFSPGYYVSLKGDTVRGEVQTNLDKEPMFYTSIWFKPKGTGKAVEVGPKKAKAYGYDETNFGQLHMDEGDVYIKNIAEGRLILAEYKFAKVEDGKEKIKSVYFIKDTKAAGDDKFGTGDYNQLPERDHKKVLKNFFRDQPILLDQVDKWVFKIDEIKKAVTEFNAMYAE